ncbi:hypothetical protein J437_LFUL018473 [Ladona fulva]|uniref:Reverse transcriptase n=1 Tax=Ladona fulva TaxID=123851 RepID=A0A8K0P977_LADFU|nr:hypothetical protein J437_LFUL018473 [Ladona fulva]
MTCYNLFIHSPFTPTPTSQHPDLLDFAISKNVNSLSHPLALNEFSSDHLPLFFTLNSYFNASPPAPLTSVRWDKYTENLINKITQIPSEAPTSTTLINTQLKRFMQYTSEAKQRASHTFIPKPNNKIHLPQHIQKKITLRNKIRRMVHTYHNPTDKHHLKVRNKQIQTDIKHHRTLLWNSKLNTINFEDNSIWKLTRSLKSTTPRLNPLLSENKFHYDAQLKSEIFIKQLTNLNLSPNIPHTITSLVNNTYDSIQHSPSPPPFLCTTTEIVNIIKTTKMKKAPGPEQITNQELKIWTHIPEILQFLTNLFNACLIHSYFPTSWKTGHVREWWLGEYR